MTLTIWRWQRKINQNIYYDVYSLSFAIRCHGTCVLFILPWKEDRSSARGVVLWYILQDRLLTKMQVYFINVLLISDFCERTFTESRDREWDFSKKFLRAENESSRGKMESWEWKWEFWGKRELIFSMGLLNILKCRTDLDWMCIAVWLLVVKSLWLKHRKWMKC